MLLIGRMTVIALLASVSVAHAYIGPGAGLSAIGSVLALLGAAFLLVLGFVWYPLKRLIVWWKGKPANHVTVSQQTPTVMKTATSSEPGASGPSPHESRES